MLDKIIHFSVHNKFIVGLFTAALVIVGIYSALTLPVDALPDITNNQVQIITTSPKLATQEVEQFITYPVEQAVKPIPDVVELRSISRFGLSVVTVVFKESTDIYWARAQISERLVAASEAVPAGAGKPELAPISTGLGEIYQYVVFPEKGYEDQYDATQLRTIQDWIIKPQLTGTPGVAEVNTLGGYLKQYEIAVQPDKLKAMNTTITEIFDALETNNENTGGAYIDKKPYAYFIRGVGMVSNLDDIRKIVVKNHNGIPILIRDVADVRIGNAIRYGAVTKDGKGEEVSGMVMMLKGENSGEVAQRVKEKIERIKTSLPKGVTIEPFLDRTRLVDKAVRTVETNLIEGALIVIFILVLLLGNWRAGLVVASVIPLSLLFAISMMRLFGVSGNLMSLGAIDFGLIVDGAVIIVEAIVHRLHNTGRGRMSQAETDAEVYGAASKIRGSAAFGEIIILMVYLPILALTGIEGKMFNPMAMTVSFAILGAFVLSLTYVPTMSALALGRGVSHKSGISDRIMDKLHGWYAPLLESAFRVKKAVVGVSIALFVGAVLLFSNLGGEFIPTLDEGDIATHLIIASGSSLSQEVEATQQAQRILKSRFPEIRMIVAKIGSAEIPTDPMPVEAADLIILLKDKDQWTSADSKEELMEKMEAALGDLPGVTTEFSQPIQMRFNELMTGVRSDVAVKIYGEDIDMLVSKGDDALKILNTVEGVTDAKAERVAGLPQITVRYNKDKLALYGLRIGDLNQVLRMGFAGESAGVVYEGEKRFDLVVRLAGSSREDISNIKSLYITLPSGNQIPLEQIAEVSYEDGPMQISRDDGRRRIVVGFNVRGRDVGSVVDEIQEKLNAQLQLPAGYYVTYGGQFENLRDANKRLMVAVPVALALILVLLFFTFRSLKQALLIFTAIPLSAIGGVLALWMRGMPFSISAGVGFIALFGVAVLNGIVLIGCFNQLKSEGMENIFDRIREGTKIRLRPVVMTAAVASLGFLPMAISTSAGAEVQKPLATVVMGGLITATLLTLIVLPILYYYVERGITLKAGAATLLLLLALPVAGSAQQNPLSLSSALDLAYKNNQSVRASQLEVQSQEQLAGSAWEIPKTEISGTFGQINSSAQDRNISITQNFNPFRIGAARKLLRANSEASRVRLAATRQEVAFSVRESWNDLLYYGRLNAILSKQTAVMDKFVHAADVRFRVGETHSLEKAVASARQLELQQRIRQNQAEIRIARSKLKLLLNLTEDFAISDTAFVPLPMLATDTTAIDQNPDYQLAQKRIAIAEAGHKAELSALWPELTAGYFIQSITGDQAEGVARQDAGLRFQGFTAGISLPVFFGAHSAKARAARINIERQRASAGYVESELKSRLAGEREQLATYASLIAYYREAAEPNARKITAHATIAYQNGDISYVEYVQNLDTANAILVGYADAVRQYNQTIITIQYLTNQ